MAVYRWKWRTIIPNLRYFIYDVIEGSQNIKTFWLAVWRFRAFDYVGLLSLMECAARQMRDLHRDHGNTLGRERIAQQLTVVAELCRRLREDDYLENAGYRDRRKWNTDQNKSFIVKHAQAMAKNDALYLGHMLRKVQHWWD